MQRSVLSTIRLFHRRLDGFLGIPHELLHVLAHRLVKRPCYYRLGDTFVLSLELLPLRQRLFVLLFPLAVMVAAFCVLYAVALVTAVVFVAPTLTPTTFRNYWLDFPAWHKILLLITVLPVVYAPTAFTDVRMAVRLLRQREPAA